MVEGYGYEDRFLAETEIRELMSEALARLQLNDQRVLIIIPDRTRTAPIPQMFRLFFDLLGKQVAALDYLIALGTHKLLNEESINQLIGVTPEERTRKYAGVRIFNHRWDQPETFVSVGRIPAPEIEELTGGLMNQAVDVRLNKLVFDYDQLIICGPTFPHEVVGFSGGNKYLFPGIGGAEVINFSHWLGALMTSYEVIGTKYTRVRRVIDRAASFLDRPKLCFSLVVKDKGLAGLFIGTPEEAYDAAANLSAKLHIKYVDRPFKRVLSVVPRMYDDIWTAAKGMYKLEPIIETGGEVILYAPHIDEISYTHGALLQEVGYHVRDYFLKQWDRFQNYPGGVLAHSTHLRGLGGFDAETGIEEARIKVTLATRIPQQRCRSLNLGYLNPDSIKIDEWHGREEEGVLLVRQAGEMLYRIKE
ncbi:MAG TPA: lactate racemase domain-containing protein [Pyrinomonadaceae bacterium]|jgi:nickel-dependent lactate racemase|nr:lactate racemase domain-containing protein [Pyrinomonadaceae bacterium]